jgi:ribonucleoside-diphosphate reductase alpha chain
MINVSIFATEYIPSYHSTFQPTASAILFLHARKILAHEESPQQMMERVVHALFSIETKFKTNPTEIQKLECEIGSLLDAGYCAMSTPILTNAGRHNNKPLSACTVPPIDLKKDMTKIKAIVDHLHQDGMGTGFNLDDLDDPVAFLRKLNDIALEGAKSGKEDRPVGNIAVLSVYHPRIREFINAKNLADKHNEKWIFNISVNIDDAFMQAFLSNTTYRLRDGQEISARALLREIAKSVYLCGDPGLLFMSRLNEGNPTPGVGEYVAVAPCGEVGLAAGESCHFGYINVAKFLITEQKQSPVIDFKKLEHATRLMVRALDNALEISIDRYAYEEQKIILQAKRKIGIGICGLADLFMQCNIAYSDKQARNLAQDIIAFINYISKSESHELAKVRGPFGAMALSKGCRYNDNPGFIEQRFGTFSTPHVSAKMWHELAQKIRNTKLLRNASTVALPPSSGASLIINASQGIEPKFSLVEVHGKIKQINPLLQKALSNAGIVDKALLEKIMTLGCIGSLSEIPTNIRHVFSTASEISPQEHLAMMESLQSAVDESISKTVNVVSTITEQEIVDILYQAYCKNLKGITIYRDNSRKAQPISLGNN